MKIPVKNKNHRGEFDFASVTDNCVNFRNLLERYPTAPASAKYEYLLFGFCRERFEAGLSPANLDKLFQMDLAGPPQREPPHLP
jgi:hypothetical protein